MSATTNEWITLRCGAREAGGRIARAVGVVSLLLAVMGCHREKGNEPAGDRSRSAMVVESGAFKPESRIPPQYTADGANISPPLTWPTVRQGTREYALVVEDRDAPQRGPDNGRWVHWILYKIPADVTQLKENVGHASPLTDPPGAIQGRNSWGDAFYRGPDPPKGSGLHHYIFRVYALDAPIAAQGAIDRAALEKAMEGHILSHGETVGVYGR